MVVKFDWDPKFSIVVVDQVTLDGFANDWTIQVKLTSEPYTAFCSPGIVLTAGNIKNSKLHKNY